MGVYPTSEGKTSPEAIPEALRARRRWMGARLVRRKDGRTDKPPFRVVSGKPIIKCDKTNPDNWATFAEAEAALERGVVDAIGFCIAAEDPLFAVDLDHAVNNDTGEVHPAAAEIVHTLATYCETSISGDGLHLFGEGKKPLYAGCKSNRLGFSAEVYDAARFVVVTGERIGRYAEPQERQEQLEWLCQRLWIKRERLYSKRPEGTAAEDLADEVLLERARRSKTGAKFRKLYDHANTEDFPSASEADFSLVNLLIFWAAGDPERIMRLFESSALYRGSDKHRSYVERSVYKALAGYSGKFYRPRDVKKARKQAEDSLRPKPDPLASYLGLLLDPSQWTGRKAASAYKTFCGMVVLAAEHGIVDDDENLRIGSDVRRLAEAAGIDGGTMSRSALPYLSERGLIRWKQGKGNKAGVFVLKKPSCQTNNTKGTTHFSVVSSVNAETALKTLRLLIRMRQGSAKGAALLRLGMASMFVAISLVNSQARGQSLDELALSTGRRKDRLREAIGHLKVAGIVRVTPDGTYRLAENFAVHYERALELSGVTYSERAQRRRHADDRARRNAKIETDKQANALAGKDQMGRVMERRREAEKGRWIEEERRKAGMTAAVFLAEEMADVVSVRFVDVRERWVKKGGKASDLLRAARYGPYRRKRSRDGYLYIDHHPARKRDSYDKKVADTARRMRERASGG